MKIIFLKTDNGNKCDGGSKVIYEYANELAKNGHDVCLYFGAKSIYKKLNLPELIRKPLAIFASLYIRPRWFKFHRNVKKRVFYNMNSSKIEKADAVIATAIDTFKPLMELPDTNGKKFYFIQGFENWDHPDEDVLETYSKTTTNIVVAKWLKNIVDEHSNKPSYLVSNCINTDLFNDKGLYRRKHSIVFHYRAADHKGPQYALDAIRKLEEKYDDLVVDIISIEDKPENLPRCCAYHQKITPKEVAEINNKTEVFMCTTVEEGFGLPGLEAMACGCAVVSTSYRGVLEYAVDGENALLSPVRDVDKMVENIVRLFEDDKLRKSITDNGIKTGRSRSLEKSAEEFERILCENCL